MRVLSVNPGRAHAATALIFLCRKIPTFAPAFPERVEGVFRQWLRREPMPGGNASFAINCHGHRPRDVGEHSNGRRMMGRSRKAGAGGALPQYWPRFLLRRCSFAPAGTRHSCARAIRGARQGAVSVVQRAGSVND